MKNQSKNGIWELQVLSTCSMNSQRLPCFSGINSLKNGKSGKIWHDNIGYIPLAGWILRNCPCSLEFTKKKMQKTGTKIEYDKLGCIPLTGWVLRFYPVFPELTQQTENRGEDWLWKARMYPTCGINCQILPYLSLINEKNGKLG